MRIRKRGGYLTFHLRGPKKLELGRSVASEEAHMHHPVPFFSQMAVKHLHSNSYVHLCKQFQVLLCFNCARILQEFLRKPDGSVRRRAFSLGTLRHTLR